MGNKTQDPQDPEKNTKNQKGNGEEADLRVILEDYDNVMENEDITRLTEGPKFITTFSMTREIVDEFKKPGLKGNFSKILRRLAATYLVHNGYATEQAEQRLKKLDTISHELDTERVILRETISKNNEVQLKNTRERADKIKKGIKLAAHIDNSAVVYGSEFKAILKRGQKRDTAVLQIKDRIRTRLQPEIKEIFDINRTVDQLFAGMKLEDVK